MELNRSQLKTGNRPSQPNARTFKEGEVLFKEGERGREMYIIKEGEIRISRESKEGEIELARLQNGAILGEMSLLDNLPRSATGTATKQTQVTLVNEQIFTATMQIVPAWLASIIRIITSRIRDANKRVGQSILRNREEGVSSLMSLLLDNNRKIVGNLVALDLEFVVMESYYTCKLGKQATLTVLQNIAKRGIVELGKDTAGKEFVYIKDLEVLGLFVEYQRLKARGRNFVEMGIPDNEVDMLNNIIYVSQKSGKETKAGTKLPMKAFLEDMAQKNLKGIESMLSNLQRREVISIFPSVDGSDNIILFKKETLSRIRKIKEWMERFSMEIKDPADAAAQAKKPAPGPVKK